MEIGEYQGQHVLLPKFPNTKQSENSVSIHIRQNTSFRQNFPTVANQKAMIFFLSAAIFRYNRMLEKVQDPTARNESLEGMVTKAKSALSYADLPVSHGSHEVSWREARRLGARLCVESAKSDCALLSKWFWRLER